MENMIISGALMVLSVLSGAFPMDPAGIEQHALPAESLGDIAGALPADTLLYVSVDMTRPNAQKLFDSSIAHLLRDPEFTEFVDSGLAPFQQQVDQMKMMMMMQLGGVDPELFERLLNGRVNLAWTRLTFPDPARPHKAKPAFVMTFDLGKDADAFSKALPKLYKSLADQNAAKIATHQHNGVEVTTLDMKDGDGLAVALYKKSLVITYDANEINGVLDGLAKGAAKSLAETAMYKDAKAKGRFNGALTAVYCNVASVLELALKDAGDKDKKILTDLGITQITHAGYAAHIVGGGFAESISITAKDTNKGIFSLFPTKPTKMTSMKFVPKNALYYSVMNLDAAGTWDAFFDLMRVMNPKQGEKMLKDLAQAEQEVGVSIQRDLLTHLGEEWAVFVAPAGGWRLIPQVVAAVEIKDPVKLQKSIQRVLEHIENQAPDRRPKDQFNVEKMTYAGHDIYYLKTFDDRDDTPITPAYTVHGDHLLVALLPQTLKEVIDGQKAGFPKLAESKTFQKAMANLSKNTTGFEYLDMEAAVGLVYNGLIPFAQIATGERENPFDMAKLPTESRVSKWFEPYADSAFKTKDGLRLEFYSPIPGVAMTVPALITGVLYN